METCEFCGTALEAETSFCGNCGHIPPHTSSQATGISSAVDLQMTDSDIRAPQQDPGILSGPNEITLLSHASTSQLLHPEGHDLLQNERYALVPEPSANLPVEDLPTSPLPSVKVPNAEEEEEKRRRAALLGLSIPLFSALTEGPAGHAPVISGTPQLGQLPSLAGTPSLGQPGAGSGFAAAGTPSFPPGSSVPQSSPYAPGSGSPSPSLPGNSSPGSPSSGPSGSSPGHPGCLMTIIIGATTLIVILASIITLGLTVWNPNLALNGSSTVAPGSTMTVHGSSFLPGSNVDLTLDNNSAIFYLQKSEPMQLAGASLQSAANVSRVLQLGAQGKHILAVQGNGSFTISVLVDPSWRAGQHTIHASEVLTHRSASLAFTIMGQAATATPTAATTTIVATPSPTSTPASAPSPTSTPTPSPSPVRTPTSRPTATPTPTPTPSPTPTPPPALLAASPLRINGATSCSVVTSGGSSNFTCQVTLTNNSRLASLRWSASFSNYTTLPTAQPGSDTIKAGSSETVTLLIPVSDDGNTITITFTGPANSVAITWYYQVIIQ